MDTANGLKISRYFTKENQSPFDQFTYEKRSSIIKNSNGSTAFHIDNVEVPIFWSQVATDILAQKYFRKAGIPKKDSSGEIIRDENGNPLTIGENSIKQVAHRLAGCWRYWGEKYHYFASPEDAQHFYDEMLYMIISQTAAPNSPQWFTTGLNWAYGITGPAQGHSFVNPDTKQLELSSDAYSRPQCHACAEYFTQIYTNEGTRYIGEIVEKNLTNLKAFDGENWVKILATKFNGEKEVFRITLKNGDHIDLTNDHLVFSSPRRNKERGKYSWKAVQELQVGNRVQMPILTETNNRTISSKNLAEARLAGWIIGDGSIGTYQNVMRLEIITINEDEHNFVLSDLKEVFGENLSYWVTKFKTKDTALQGRRIHLSGKKLHEFVYKFGLHPTNSRTAKVPKLTIYSSPLEKREFLKALFQADGCVRIRKEKGNNYGNICLTTCSPQLSFEVLQLLNSLGIYARLSHNKDRRENRQDTKQVVISYGSERNKFLQQIGFIGKKKTQKLILLNTSITNSKQLPKIREESIVSIEQMGVKKVYDIQTESGKFLGNGIIIHNCFIQSIDDDLVREGGIFSLLTREARIFKYGSGTGSNFSKLRGKSESLSGGGSSSGVMSFLKIFDAAAGSIKSGGTTRRAAKMVCLDLDHPEIEDFVWWKVREEEKVASLVAGSKILKQRLSKIIELAKNQPAPLENPQIRKALRQAAKNNIPVNYLVRTLTLAQQGYDIPLNEFDTHYESEAYLTVSGQNSNNSIRIPNEFFSALDSGKDWELKARSNGSVIKKIPAKKLWDDVGYCAWASADPGVQFETTINEWHTCPNSGKIHASNPCSEFLFLDDSACNLASINLTKFYDVETGLFNLDGYRHAIRLWTIALEISVLMAQFPSEKIALNSYKFRPLGLGFANIGTLLMLQGIPYDSEKGRSISAALAAIMTGDAYAASAEIASIVGPFEDYEQNKESMLRVIHNHRRAAFNRHDYENLTVLPQPLHPELCPQELLNAAQDSWDNALAKGERYGYRNAQVSVLAPTGTIGLVMDCDTTGVEPDYALVKYKKLAGGGFFKIVNQSVPAALKRLGYTETQIQDIIQYCLGSGTLKNAPFINSETLAAKGLTALQIDAIEKELHNAMDLKYAFNPWTLGKEFYQKIMLHQESSTPFLEAFGFSTEEINAANEHICGTMTVEGSPHLLEEHLPIFDCASKCGKKGQRYIHPYGHLKMVAANQSFISGAISKTINMPREWTIPQVQQTYYDAWKMMTKAVALYRDGCKLSQPLNTTFEEHPHLKKVLEEEDDFGDSSVKILTKKVALGQKELLLTSSFVENRPPKISVVINNSTPAQEAMIQALVNTVNLGLQSGLSAHFIAEKSLKIEGHPLIPELALFLSTLESTSNQVFNPTADKTALSPTPVHHSKEKCRGCGADQLRRNGTCMLCEVCGETSGCS